MTQAKLRIALICMTLAFGIVQLSFAQQPETVYVVTYIEARPAAADAVRELITTYAAQGQNAGDNGQFLGLQRIARSNHFAVVEAWQNTVAYERFAASDDAVRFRERLAPLLYSPPDQRSQRGLATGAHRQAGAGAIYVLTHVDVLPQSLQSVVDDITTMAEASRAEPGNLQFDLLVTERRNHMTIVEAWRSADMHAAHLGNERNEAFRARLAPVLGALYDERLYRVL